MGSIIAGGEVIDLTNSKYRMTEAVTESAPVVHENSDTQLNEPAPAFHAPDAEVAETDRRRRRNSNGGPVGPLTRSRAKRVKRPSDHLSPAMSHRLAMRGLHDHNDPA